MCSGALIWLFSPAWDAVELTLKVGFICPFVVDDPTDLGATIVVAQALCLSIFNLSPTQKTCLFTDGNKDNVYLVDGSESMGDRNAKFVYLDFACESDIPAALHFARTTLVESTRTLGAHELILVFYGAHYEAKLMDGIRDCA